MVYRHETFLLATNLRLPTACHVSDSERFFVRRIVKISWTVSLRDDSDQLTVLSRLTATFSGFHQQGGLKEEAIAQTIAFSGDLVEERKEVGNCTLKKMIPIIYKLVYPFFRFYWFVFRPKTRGVICLILSGDDLLLIRQTYGRPVWTLSGGGFKKDENKEEAVKREVREELGLNITPEYLGEFTHHPEHKIDTVSCFVARMEKVDPKIDHLEIKEARWWNINNLPKNHSASLQRVISMYQAR